jgi:hypothetical protein
MLNARTARRGLAVEAKLARSLFERRLPSSDMAEPRTSAGHQFARERKTGAGHRITTNRYSNPHLPNPYSNPIQDAGPKPAHRLKRSCCPKLEFPSVGQDGLARVNSRSRFRIASKPGGDPVSPIAANVGGGSLSTDPSRCACRAMAALSPDSCGGASSTRIRSRRRRRATIEPYKQGSLFRENIRRAREPSNVRQYSLEHGWIGCGEKRR